MKTREGRPIFIKTNCGENLAVGAINARINTSVLDLYDNTRLQGPMKGGAAISWAGLDEEVKTALEGARGKVAELSNTIICPTTQQAIDAFTNAYQGRHVMVDSYGYGVRRGAQEQPPVNGPIP